MSRLHAETNPYVFIRVLMGSYEFLRDSYEMFHRSSYEFPMSHLQAETIRLCVRKNSYGTLMNSYVWYPHPGPHGQQVQEPHGLQVLAAEQSYRA